MLKYFLRLILFFLLELPFVTGQSQTVYSQWASPAGHASYTRSPDFLCTSLTCVNVSSLNNTSDNNLANYALIDFPLLSVLSSVTVTMDLSTPVTTGLRGGVYLQAVNSLVGLTVLPIFKVELLNNSTVVASETYTSVLNLSLLTTSGMGMCVQPSSSTYNKVRLTITAPVGVGIPMQFRLFYAFGNTGAGCLNSTLPLTLSSFRADARVTGDVSLEWITHDEKNTSHFEVDRQREGEKSWTKVASVTAGGNVSGERKYNYLDRNAGCRRTFYRLKSVDLDGTAMTHGTKTTLVSCQATASGASFSRIGNQYFIRLTSPAVEHKVLMHDVSGRKYNVQYYQSGGIIEMNCSGLRPGVYLVTLVSAHNYEVIKIVITPR